MLINIVNPVLQTYIFITVLMVVIFATLKRSIPLHFSVGQSTELKGLAILMVIFGHIGYFLVSDHRFLFPLSVDSGVGVNIFFFLSGFGLCASLSKPGSKLLGFYRKRLLGVYPSMWIVVSAFFLLDMFILGRSYPINYVIRTFIGFFPSAKLIDDINSPLWYFTPIVFYYLVFPFLYIKKYPWISACLLALIGYLLVRQNLPIEKDVLKLYETHYLAFPLGVLFYSLARIRIVDTIRKYYIFPVRLLLLLCLMVALGYFSIHSGVGEGVRKEQMVSLITVCILAFVSILKGISSRFLLLVGTYSYEIYLLHWPLMSRYDILYAHLPASIATIAYLVLLLVLGWGLNRLTRFIH